MLSKTMIIGRLGMDPEIKTIAGGQSVARISVATNERWTDRDGKKQEKTEWHNIVIWGKTAENAAKFLVKGSMAYFEGKNVTRSWDDNGTKRYTTEVVATIFRNLSPLGSQQQQDTTAGFEEPTTYGEIPF